MPKYLAKDYLSDYLTSNVEFVSRSLLTEPRHLEAENRYAHNDPNKLQRDVSQLLTELKSENCEEDDGSLLLGGIEGGGINGLEEFDDSSLDAPPNIVQIDSDSDFDIGSSFGSSVADGGGVSAEELSRKVHSVMDSSICSDEIKRSSPHLDLLFDIMDEQFDPTTFNTANEVLSLHARLKPVRVSDPLKELSQFESVGKLCGYPQIQQGEEGEEVGVEEVTKEEPYVLIDVHGDVGLEPYIEASPYEGAAAADASYVDVVELCTREGLDELLDGLQVDSLQEEVGSLKDGEGELLNLGWTPRPLEVERITGNERVVPITTTIIKTTATTPASLAPQASSATTSTTMNTEGVKHGGEENCHVIETAQETDTINGDAINDNAKTGINMDTETDTDSGACTKAGEALPKQVRTSPESRSKQLDCPETSFMRPSETENILPNNLCQKDIAIEEEGKGVVSPNAVEEMTKKCFNEEKCFIELSHMLIAEQG